MNIERTEGTDRGVSVVIGVILMVGITVLLAATVGTFFIGVGENTLGDRSPTVAMDYDLDLEGGSYVLTIRHAGGDLVDSDHLRFHVANAACDAGSDPDGRYAPRDLDNSDSRISAGSRFTLSRTTLACAGGSDLDLSTAAVTVVWVDSDGHSSAALWRWHGPSA